MSHISTRILNLALSCILFGLTANAESYPVPFKTKSGVYGYHATKDGDHDIWPMYSYAGKFVNGFAPASFDNHNFGLINNSGFFSTEICFKGIPGPIRDGVVTVDDQNGRSYIADLSGKELTPHMPNLKFTHGYLIATDTASRKAVMFRPDLSVAHGPRHTKYDFYDNQVRLNDSLYSFRVMRGIDDVYQGKLFVNNSLIDATGASLLPEGLTNISTLDEHTYFKGIKDKVFTDNGVSPSMRSLFFAGRLNGKVGIYFIDGTEIVPPTNKDTEKAVKQFAKIFKKSILPRWKNGELPTAAVNVIENLNRKEAESIAAFQTAWGVDPKEKLEEFTIVYGPVYAKKETVNQKSKARAKKGKKARKTAVKTVYRFDTPYSLSTKPGELVFDDLIDNSVCFFGKKPGEKKYHLYNSLGIQMTVDPYDEIQSLGYTEDDEQRFKVRNGKDWGIIDVVGREILSPQFSEIETGYSSDKTIVVVRDGKYYLVDYDSGKFVNGIAYDSMESYSYKGGRSATRLGYMTKVYENGKEDPSIGTQAYNEACNADMSPEEKVLAFANCIELCGPDDRDILGMAYNNMGYYYNEAGDEDNARKFYKKAIEYGNERAANNLRALNGTPAETTSKSYDGGNLFSTLGQIANALGQMGGNTAWGGFFNGMAGNGVTTTDVSVDMGGGSYSSESRSSSGGSPTDPTYYTNTYRRWEREAKSNYESLTMRGTRTSRGGKAESGTTDGFWRHHTAGLKRLLRNAQSEMRKTRQEARRAGVTIQQSEYETVTVSY